MKSKSSQVQSNSSTSRQNKAIVFDSGALISFSLNGITEIIEDLKKNFKGKFLITSEIKREIIDFPLKVKRFELEALKLKNLFDRGILESPSSIGIKDNEIFQKTNEILDLANNCFVGDGKAIKLINGGEASCLALSTILTQKGIKNVLAVDERTTRMLAENPEELKNFLERKLHVKIKTCEESSKFFKNFKIIRSPELVYVAYKKNLIKLKDKNILDALLYAVKFKGASISSEEIEEMKRLARV